MPQRYNNYLTPPIAIGYKSCCGNFSQPIQSVSKASVPSVRCSRRSSSDSGCFSMDLFLRKPLRPRSTLADRMARIKSSLFWRLKYGMRRCLPAKMNTCHFGGEIKADSSTDIAWDGGTSYQDNSIG